MEFLSEKDSLISHKLKAVIFDFDGTIADTMPFLTELAVVLITEKYNVTKDEAERRYLETTGIDFAFQLELLFPNHPNNREVAATFELRKVEGIFAHPVFSDVIPTLKYFRNKKNKIFICSSTKQEIITRYFRLNTICDLADGIFGYKPNFRKNEQIEFVLRHYKMQPDEVLFVGDSLRDYDFAKDAKIKFIGISGIFGKPDFQKKGALSVSCLKNLVKLFDKNGKVIKSFEGIK